MTAFVTKNNYRPILVCQYCNIILLHIRILTFFRKLEVLCRKNYTRCVRVQSLTMQFINHFDDLERKLNCYGLSYSNENCKLCLRAIEKEFVFFERGT